MIGDPDPAYDDCSDADHTSTSAVVGMAGKNVGDLLNAQHVTWGWFQGGFTPSTAWDGKTGDYAKCDTTTANIGEIDAEGLLAAPLPVPVLQVDVEPAPPSAVVACSHRCTPPEPTTSTT